MKNTSRALAIAAASAVLITGGATAAFASTGSGAPSTDPSQTSTVQTGGHPGIAAAQARLDARLAKLSSRVAAAQTKVDASTKLTADQKATLEVDLTKAATDIATARTAVDAATDRAGVKTALADLATLKQDAAKIRADLVADRGTRSAAPSDSPSALSS